MIQVQIVDDHKMFVEGIERIINGSGIAKVTAKSHSSCECRQMLSTEQADVLLLDIHLPDGNGVDLCAEILSLYPKLKILALTSYSEYAVVNRMMSAGALGYVLKNAMAEEILQGIEGRLAGFIQSHYFAIDDRLIRHRGEGFCDPRVPAGEVIIVAGSKLHLAGTFDGERPVSIELDFI